MTVEPRDLAAHLVPEITEGRLARQWASVEARLPRPGQSVAIGWRGAALAASALGAAVWLLMAPVAQRPVSGAVVESSDTPVAVQLRDGSSLELAAQTRLRVLRDQPSVVELELAEGRASFDVTHVKDRSFTVLADSVAVRVIGTKFDVVKVVRAEGTEVQVSVERGIVEVERTDRGDQHRLTVGERWSVWIPAEPIGDPAELAQDDDDDDPVYRDAPARASRRRKARSHSHHRTAGSAARSVGAGSRASERAAAQGDVQDSQDAQDGHEPPAAVDEESGSEVAGNSGEARDLFVRATVARRAGMMGQAADDYAEVMTRFPKDPRVPIAAFELGRIRMDALGDSRGAAAAFSQALRSRSFANREDALARLAISFDALGDTRACRKARRRYLSEYPAGVHTKALLGLCADGGAHSLQR